MDSDAEWVGVDFEFGGPRDPTTPRPTHSRPRPLPPTAPPRPVPRPPIEEPRQDSPEKAPSSPSAPVSSNAGVLAGCVGGALGVVLLLLLVYMAVLRRRLSKAKTSGRASRYQLRVEDVAHLSHLDETTNTYVNTTDLQKLVASVRAKGKSENRLPTPPRLQHQTPAAYRPPVVTRGDNDAFQVDKVVVRAPMPPPYTATAPHVLPQSPVAPQPVQEVIYSNLQECAVPPRPAPRLEAPKVVPPPPPIKEPKSPVTQPARPAPAPPKSSSPLQPNDSPSPVQDAKPVPLPAAFKPRKDANPVPPPAALKPGKDANPVPPPAALKPGKDANPVPPPTALKPGKVTPGMQARLGAKPTPPTLPKPGKGKALPPLKMVLRGAVEGASSDTCTTPDTALTHLSPDTTPTGEGSPGVASISCKIALLEGHMRTAGGGVPRPGGVRL